MAGFSARHFSLEELLHSDAAARHGIPNEPTDEIRANLQRLAAELLDPLRDAVGAPLRVTSGYRCPRLNALIGGAPASAHMAGRAADLVWWGHAPAELERIARRSWPQVRYDKLIVEFGRWLHVQIAAPGKAPRRETLEAYRDDAGRARYRPYDAKSAG